MNNALYVSMHNHCEYSQLDGMGHVKDWVARAKELGCRSLAISDHGNVDCAIELMDECLKQGINPIIACEAYMVPDMKIKAKSERRGHICLFVQNEEGWSNLLYMLTKANLEGYYRRPRIDFDLLLHHHKGLVISTACVASFLYLEGGMNFFYSLVSSKYGENIYLEVMPHLSEEQAKLNRLCRKLSRDTGVPLIATNDAHYINKNDKETHEVLLAIQRGAKWNDPNRWKFDPAYEIWFKDADEMLEGFRRQGVLSDSEAKLAIMRTTEIAKLCGGFRIPNLGISLPSPPIEKSENEYFRELCIEGRNKTFGDKWPTKEYEERFEYEYKVITEKNFSRYFIVVKNLLDWCRANNIMTGPRGSVGCSLIAMLLGITIIDPVKYSLPFSRFINEERIDTPDADIDVEDVRRDDIKAYLKEQYGEFNVASISTFLRMKGKLVVRDVGRVFDVDLLEVDKFSKSIRETIDDGLEGEEGKNFQRSYPDVIRHAKQLEGQIRNGGMHAAGIIVADEDLRKTSRCYLTNRRDSLTVNWDGPGCERMGLIKLDILGLNTLSILTEAKNLLKARGIEIDYEKLPLDDPNIFADMSNGHVSGIFQMGYAVRALLNEISIESIEEWSDVIALARPGPSDSGTTALYIERKKGKKWEPKHPIFEEVTKKTYGTVVFQEQVMNVIHKVAGLPYHVADKIRKIIGKKRDPKDFEQFKDMFVNGCIEKETLTEKEANEFWDELQYHAWYSFNASHSLSYAIVGYWTAYIRHYYPSEFIAASLTHGRETSKRELVSEARRLGLDVIPPRMGKSDAMKWICDGKKLYVPFKEIKGIGEKTAIKLAENCSNKLVNKKRKGFFVCDEKAANYPSITGKTRELLERVGAFSSNEDLPQGGEELFDFAMTKNLKDGYPKLMSILGKDFDEKRIADALEGNVRGLKLFSKSATSYKLGKALSECKKCELREECPGPVYPSTSRNPIMIVGEAPFKDESKQGKPFVGRVSAILWDTLAKFDLMRDDFYITNAVKCPPLSSKNPSPSHVSACRGWLEEEIRNVKPFLILSLGRLARLSLVGEEKGIIKANGTVVWSEEFGAWIVFAAHPGYVNRNKTYLNEFENALNVFSLKIQEIGGV